MDTIFAQATAPGKAGVSILRISGPDARIAAAAIGVRLDAIDRKLCTVTSRGGELIDIAFALSFASGHSFTGEDVVELHLHGSPAIVSKVLQELSMLGLRQAEAGEFTRRALQNGRIDLAQVEGLADLIEAETEEQRRQAVRVLDGAIGKLVDGWRDRLIRAAALLEASIDFADEDVPEDVLPEVEALLRSVHGELVKEAKGARVRERIRDGFEVGIVGPPNAGKSTLLNRLAGREAAITSEYAGTTRDVIEVRMDLSGLPVTFLDTAGIRESSDHVESIGIQRGLNRARQADLRIHLVDLGCEPMLVPVDGDIVVVAKADLLVSECPGLLAVSGATGEGVDELVTRITQTLTSRVQGAGAATRLRHAEAIGAGAELVGGVVVAIENQGATQLDLLSEDLRTAIRALDTLVGRIDVETLLDEIFSSFCIGK